jgi:hypothetical protein
VQSSFIILAPLFIGAGSYALVSRLCLSVLPPATATSSLHLKIYGIPVAKLTRIFVTFDIISLLIQVSGSAIASSSSWTGSTVGTGENILIAGLATQVLTFGFFLAVMVRFHLLTRIHGEKETAPGRWRRMMNAVYVSCSLIMVCAKLCRPPLSQRNLTTRNIYHDNG